MWKKIKQLSQLIGKLTTRVIAGTPLLIHGYRSFGNNDSVLLRGRIIENEGITVTKEDGFYRNLINNIRRFETDELRSFPVVLEFQEQKHRTLTDREGYFSFHLPSSVQNESVAIQWSRASLTLPEHRYKTEHIIQDEIEIMWPGLGTKYGIISDIDDTILMSHVGSWLKLQMIYVTLFQNVYQRKAFEGMSDALSYLSTDSAGTPINPIFYVSNSPWSLYEVLEEFLHIHSMPKGPLLLRDYGAFFGKQLEDFRHHKSNSIDQLLNFYPHLPYILIGDATEQDADIYLEKYKQYPGRIKAIFIRRGRRKESNLRIKQLFSEHADIPCYLVDHSRDIMQQFSSIITS